MEPPNIHLSSASQPSPMELDHLHPQGPPRPVLPLNTLHPLKSSCERKNFKQLIRLALCAIQFCARDPEPTSDILLEEPNCFASIPSGLVPPFPSVFES